MGDEKYFEEYEDLRVHELMLKDRPRQKAYCDAIKSNASLFKTKVILDVGAGTGILSIFCAQAGAKKVFAVEPSKVAHIAIEAVQENDVSDVVEIIQCRIEDFELPAEQNKVDIVVSEWMGFYLLHEGMLESVIFARDKFLKEGGIMFPQYASIYIAPCSIPNHFDYWENIDGVKMAKFATRLREEKSSKPEIMVMGKENLLHEGVAIAWLDLNQVKKEELNEITAKEVFAVQKTGKFQGFSLWFECDFPSENGKDPITLTTSPCAEETHWKQCVIMLPELACHPVSLKEPIAVQISIKKKMDDNRKYNLEVEMLDPDTTEHPLPCNCYLTKCILTKAHLESISDD